MAVTPNLGLASPLISGVAGWIARLKADLSVVDGAFAGLAGTANLFVNPGFELNQRALSSYTGNGTFGPDRWQAVYIGAVSLTMLPEFGVMDALSSRSVRCDFVLGSGQYATCEQTIEAGAATYKGQPLTFRLRVKCSTANAVCLTIFDQVGYTQSPFHTGDGTWQTLAVTRVLDPSATLLRAGAQFLASCTAYLDNATLTAGTVGLPYAPLGAGEELRRCERFYEVGGGGNGTPYIRAYSAIGAGDVHTISVPWREKKGGPPTVTKVGTWAVNNANQPTVSSATVNGYTLQITSLGVGYFDATPNGSDDLIISEWNP